MSFLCGLLVDFTKVFVGKLIIIDTRASEVTETTGFLNLFQLLF